MDRRPRVADLTTLTTFKRTVMGNKVIVYCDVPGGRSTDDLIVPRHITAIDFVTACYRSSVVTASSVTAAVSFDGTTVSIFTPAATTATALTIKVEGR
jgi:hypothetical protein